MNQPRPATVQAATPAPPHDRQTTRLIQLWTELTQRAAQAAAHQAGEEIPLYDLQRQVEEAITDRLPGSDELLAELWAWEATLLHTGDTTAGDCLVCRRGRLGPPIDLLVPTGNGGAA